MLGQARIGEETGVDPRVQGLDATVEALGESREVGHGRDGDA